jgi:hypothetical protein
METIPKWIAKKRNLLELLQNTPLSRCAGIVARDFSDGGTTTHNMWTCTTIHQSVKGHLNLKTCPL